MAVNPHGRAWLVYLTVGALAAAVYVALPLGPLAEGVFYDGLGLLAVAGIVLGVRLNRPRAASAWYLIALSQLLFVLGDVVWTVFDLRGIDPWPSIADGFYLAGYPVLAAGLLRLIRARRDTGDRRALIDASIVALGLGVLAWVFLIDPYVDDRSLSVVELIISVAYPLGDVLVMAVAARLAVGGSGRHPAFRFLGASVLALLVADVLYGIQLLGPGYVSGGWVDGLWLLSYVLLAVTALHPSVVRLSQPQEAPEPVGRRRLAILAAAALLAPLAIVLQGVRGFEAHDVLVLAVCAAALFLLVVARMGGLVRELERVVRERSRLQEERRRLTERTMRASEEERMRIAADLHDGPLQRLAQVGYGLDRVRLRLERGDPEAALTVLEPLQDSLSTEVHSLRTMMSSLRPPALDEHGLEGALRDAVSLFADLTGRRCEVRADLPERLGSDPETVLYRVAQEALRNIEKHAGESDVGVQLRQANGQVELSIVDHGVGFDAMAVEASPPEGHVGISAMRELVRMAGGTFRIESSPGVGTTVTSIFPRSGA